MESKNLKPQNQRTKSEQRKIASSGGIASGKSRREKRIMRERLEILLAMPAEGGGDNGDALCVALLKAALMGDVKAFEMIRDTVGEKPVEKKDLTNSDGSMTPKATVQIYRIPDNGRD